MSMCIQEHTFLMTLDRAREQQRQRARTRVILYPANDEHEKGDSESSEVAPNIDEAIAVVLESVLRRVVRGLFERLGLIQIVARRSMSQSGRS